MVQGVPRIVTVSDCQLDTDGNSSRRPEHTPPMQCGGSLRNEYELLNDARVMMHISGTYDTYKCMDCNIVLSGYKRGDPGLNEHLQRGGQCRYIKMKYWGREKELLILQGKLRFQCGLIAFPEFLLSSNNGYVNIAGVKHCSICTCLFGEDHYIACEVICKRLKVKLKSLEVFWTSSYDALLFKVPRLTSGLFGCSIATDGSLAHFTTDFTVLGESANMYHRAQTVDTHTCYQCHIDINNFVQNDTLLGEHIYHVYNAGSQCPYIEDRFNGRQPELMSILGNERYRKGSIAFPAGIINAVYGFITIGGVKRCLVCSAMTFQGAYLPPQGHYQHCDEMTKSLTSKLKHMKFII